MFYLNVKAKQSILWENLLFFMVSYDSYKTENFWFSFLFSFFKEHRSLFKSSWDDSKGNNNHKLLFIRLNHYHNFFLPSDEIIFI